jgi:hypothetical protein
MRNGCRRRPTVHEWPAKFGPYALGYQPRSSKHRVPTWANQELKPSPIHESVEGKKTCIEPKKKLVVLKYRSISAIGLGIGGNGDGRGFFTYRPDFDSENGNFTDFATTKVDFDRYRHWLFGDDTGR